MAVIKVVAFRERPLRKVWIIYARKDLTGVRQLPHIRYRGFSPYFPVRPLYGTASLSTFNRCSCEIIIQKNTSVSPSWLTTSFPSPEFIPSLHFRQRYDIKLRLENFKLISFDVIFILFQKYITIEQFARITLKTFEFTGFSDFKFHRCIDESASSFQKWRTSPSNERQTEETWSRDDLRRALALIKQVEQRDRENETAPILTRRVWAPLRDWLRHSLTCAHMPLRNFHGALCVAVRYTRVLILFFFSLFAYISNNPFLDSITFNEF